MEDRKREARRKMVLDIIVRYYIDSVEPVGSRTVSDEMELSSATVRNIMFDLERLGFICQPYTSAGRIPTEKGYRFYVNSLMEPKDISQEEKRHIELIYQLESDFLEDVIEESSHILSYLSSLAAIAMFPRANDARLYLDGTHHILEQPDFKDPGITTLLFKALEEKRTLLDMFKDDLGRGGTRVRIGSENNSSVLSHCSTISATYKIRGNAAGTVSVLGPTRMEYSKLIPVVDYLAKTMSDLLETIS